MIDKITFAGTSSPSWPKAARALSKLAGVSVSAMEVSRITQQIGEELLQQRESESVLHQRRQLPVASAQAVDIACVQVDGGRMRTREAGEGPGVHEHAWKETKVAALWRMEGETFDHDPHPQPPRCFLNEQHVSKMVGEIKRQRAEQHPHEDEKTGKSGSEPDSAPPRESEATERHWPPRRVFRSCVATLQDVHGFGLLVAAEAQQRGFYEARRQVFLGDGDHKNWTVHKLHFPFFTAITDFVHPVTYLYDAAAAVTSSWVSQWEQYTEWMTACWQGRVSTVLNELREWQDRWGVADQDTPDNDPRRIIATTLTYLQNNEPRMNYAHYRQQGLPITSCLVESLIKEVNQRVKGTEQFWNRPPGEEGEAILQTTASLLSDGEPLTKHILSRPGSLYYRRTTEANLAKKSRTKKECC